MDSTRYIYKTIHYFIAAVWFANGLFCKVLNFVPRHEQIVARILSDRYAVPFTIAIGISETLMAIWILTGIYSRLNAIFQMVIVAAMNIIEFTLAPDLLLFGRVNAIFASIFIVVIYVNEFILNRKIDYQH